MVEINPSAPQPKDFNPANGNMQAQLQPFQVGGGWDAYKNWLGPEGYKKFQSMLCQNISTQINRDKEKEQKRKEIMRKSIDGETDIYSP